MTMSILEKINFRQPKYMLPAILYLPLLGASYFIFDLFRTEKAEVQDTTLQTTEFLNPELPEATLKNGDGIGSKYENMTKSWGRIQDYTAVDNIERDEPDENKEEYESKYTDDDIALLGEVEQEKSMAAEAADGKKREEEALAELEKALAEARLRGQQEVTPPAKEDTAQTEVPPVEPQAEGRIDEDSRAVKTPGENDKASEVVKKAKASSDYFHTLDRSSDEPKLIQAIIDEDIKAVDGSRVRLRLLDDVEIDGSTLRKGTYLYATVSGFSSGRVKGSISSILVGDKLVKVSLSLYDTDGLEGLYVPESQFREDEQGRGQQRHVGQPEHEHRRLWQQPRPMGNAGRAERLPENEQRHQQGHQEEQGQTEVRHLRVFSKRKPETIDKTKMEQDKIYHMDCLEGMKQIADRSVDAVIADLPYGVLNRQNGAARWGPKNPACTLMGAVPENHQAGQPHHPVRTRHVHGGTGIVTAQAVEIQPRLAQGQGERPPERQPDAHAPA